MDTARRLTPSRRLLLGCGAILLAAATLAACSSASPGSAGTSAARATVSRNPEPSTSASSAKAEPSASGVAIDLPLTWLTDAARRDGNGYALTLTPTSRQGVYDAHFFHQAKDGAVSGQKFLTITATARDTLSVTWPDGNVESGTLALIEDGSPQTEITLDPGCLAYLQNGRSQLDCRLYPADAPVPSAAPSPNATTASVPTTDEAMGYLCSVGVDELSRVTDTSSDPYATSVLQVALGALGYDPGPVDGTYGKKSRAAVLAYQADASLTADGLVGPKTWTSLQADACRIPDDPAQ